MFKYRLLPGADATTRPNHLDCIPSKPMNLLRNGWNFWIRHNYIDGGKIQAWALELQCNDAEFIAWQNWILFCHSKDVTIIAEKPRLAAKKQVPRSAGHVFKANWGAGKYHPRDPSVFVGCFLCMDINCYVNWLNPAIATLLLLSPRSPCCSSACLM